DRAVERSAARSGGSSSGAALTVGALLDGIPEQLVLGIGLAAGEGVSLALLVAIFMSNLPESIAATADSLDGGKTRRHLLVQWSLVAVVCALATWGGGLIADVASPALTGGIQGFAAGALLVMLIDTMIPEAREKGGERAGLLTVVGFALGAFLSLVV
ncbi:ZIP family metal transporter, partial [Micrococcus sp. KRD070]